MTLGLRWPGPSCGAATPWSAQPRNAERRPSTGQEGLTPWPCPRLVIRCCRYRSWANLVHRWRRCCDPNFFGDGSSIRTAAPSKVPMSPPVQGLRSPISTANSPFERPNPARFRSGVQPGRERSSNGMEAPARRPSPSPPRR